MQPKKFNKFYQTTTLIKFRSITPRININLKDTKGDKINPLNQIIIWIKISYNTMANITLCKN
jgi:hypothetical protein